MYCASQRGRGRRGGRAVRERGRMRKRGPRGGGTLRRKSPQQGQWPSPPSGAVASARSQWPRASHCGLMHCTVKPGKNCIFSPSEAAKLKSIQARPFCGRDQKNSELPLAAKSIREKSPGKTLRKKCSGRANVMARILTRMAYGVKRKGYKILW